MKSLNSKFMFLFFIIGILIFAFAPGQLTPAWVVNHDKFSHFMVFFILGFMVRFAFAKLKLIWLLVLLVLFAFMIEFLQFSLFNRGFSAVDIGYDLLGIGLFLLCYIGIITMFEKLMLNVGIIDDK